MTTTELPKQVVTLDMDGTMEDPWACCSKRDRMGGSKLCRHLRTDTIERARRILAVYPDAQLVILSWRMGLEGVTRRWLADVDITVAKVFIPGSADARALGITVNRGQVGFKVDVVRALQAQGTQVLASFDDNADVIAALADEVWGAALVAPRLVHIAKHEWAAGFIGAKAEDAAYKIPEAFKGDWYNTRAPRANRQLQLALKD